MEKPYTEPRDKGVCMLSKEMAEVESVMSDSRKPMEIRLISTIASCPKDMTGNKEWHGK